jgi:alanine dehydrogenase
MESYHYIGTEKRRTHKIYRHGGNSRRVENSVHLAVGAGVLSPQAAEVEKDVKQAVKISEISSAVLRQAAMLFRQKLRVSARKIPQNKLSDRKR